MKAVICEEYGFPERLIVRERPDPIAGEGQVLIQVAVCGVNFPDLLIIQNKYQLKPDPPFSPGGEVAGKIIAVGSHVETLKVGDSVIALCGYGGFAEKVAVDSDRVVVVPANISPKVSASTLYNYATSYHALKDRAQLLSGEVLLVMGAAGGVGLAAVELGKLIGAKVIAAASSEEKLELCREKGALQTINYAKENLKSRLKELTGGKGVDVIFDPVGGEYTETALRGIAWKGRHLIVGFAGDEIPKIPMNLPLLKGCSLVGVFWSQFSKSEPDVSRENIRQLIQWMVEGKIKQTIYKEYSLDEAPEALKALMNRTTLGKGVIVIS